MPFRQLAIMSSNKNTFSMGARESRPGNPYWRGRIGTVDLPAWTSSNQLLLIVKMYIFLFYKEANCTELSPSVRIPWLGSWAVASLLDF